MPVSVTVSALDLDDVLLGYLSDFVSLNYTLAARDSGVLSVTVVASHPVAQLVTRDMLLKVEASWGGSLARDAVTVWLVTQKTKAFDGELELITISAESNKALLKRRVVAYASATSQTAKSGPADDVMKSFVYENIGPGASPAYRAISGFTVAACGGLGPTVAQAATYRNLLDVIYDIHDETITTGSPVYFDVEYTSGSWQFATYPTLLGVNRGASSPQPVILSKNRGSIARAEYSFDWSGEQNLIYALGQGQEADREVQSASSTAACTNRISLREGIANYSNVSASGTLLSVAQQKLQSERGRESFFVSVISTPNQAYGVEFGLGDLVVVEDPDFTYEAVIEAVGVTFDSNGVSLDIKTSKR